MPDVPWSASPLDLVAELRRQVTGLVAHIDTTGKPVPDHVNPARHRLPGPVWHPVPGWTVRVIHDGESLLDSVYLTTPHMYAGTDFDAYRVAAVRRIAMAMLAACDAADARMAGVVVLGGRDLPEYGNCQDACHD
ncbi:hypothetical protein ETD86_41000 [Nonomuraea turkmeniaca]|uniref:Uncharacterized protein n=1 Tax=Nonomuraea turkmeniaca TaxID=103838 RepID=A0A5S4F1Y4_9ACTN|nr:hypothetical protein [Nonomuraea turkmeniaca]TMR10106.1 hypothetical protein ETD86_41000 [Nonomuraea turkmeniaca]